MEHERLLLLKALRKIALVSDTDRQGAGAGKKEVYILLRCALSHFFSEEWYLSRNEDVEREVRNGTWESGISHYCWAGIYEGRAPFPVALNEQDYLIRHPDVKKAIENGLIESAQEHFYSKGFMEGRSYQLAKSD